MFAAAGLARRLMRFICSMTSHRRAGQVIAAIDLSVSSGRVRFVVPPWRPNDVNGQPLCKAAATLPLAPLISEPLALSLYERDVYQAIHGRPFVFVGLPSRRLVRRLSLEPGEIR
jgi:hypothetical protein